MIKLMNPLKSYGLQTKCVTMWTTMTPTPMTTTAHDAYVSTLCHQRLEERICLYDEGATMQRIYTWGLRHYEGHFLCS